jgi:hypothetical protein
MTRLQAKEVANQDFESVNYSQLSQGDFPPIELKRKGIRCYAKCKIPIIYIFSLYMAMLML